MRKAIIGTALAAVTVVSPLAAPAQQAQAADPATILAAAKTAYEVYKFVSSMQDVPQTETQKVITAIGTARTAIMAHIDKLALAQAQACADSAVIEYPDLRLREKSAQQTLAENITKCVTLVKNELAAVSDKAAADSLGF